MPRVFITYAHQSKEHATKVLSLAQQLRSDGVDCQLDAFINGHPDEGWMVWMERQIAESDYILMVCSEVYLRRFKGEEEYRKGRGVIWESQLTRAILYEAQGTHLKVVPVCFSESDREFIPEIIRHHTSSYVVSAQYEKLFRYLTQQPEVIPQKVGTLRRIPSAQSPTSFGLEPRAFSQSIVDHMASLNRRVETLTNDQIRVIKQLRLMRRVRISGIPGSGKTLVAAEKAIRTAEAGLRTLFLCHNRLLAHHVQGLTNGSAVIVTAFTDWVYGLAGVGNEEQAKWTKYDEPTADILGSAFDLISRSTHRYDAIIVDEGQDFRSEWWTLIEACLADSKLGIFYIFHDDRQALLPHRATYPFEEPIIDLSRNCRNGGRIYDAMRCLCIGAPECEPDLRDLGHLSVEISRTGFDQDALQRAIAWFPKEELKHLIVVFCGSAAVTEAMLSKVHVPFGTEISWREEVRRLFAQACTGRSLTGPSGGYAALEERLEQLSTAPSPTAEDVKLVSTLAKQFKLDPGARRHVLESPNHQQGLRWQMVGSRVRLRRKRGSVAIWASDIIMHFERDDWHEGMPNIEIAQLGRDTRVEGRLSLPAYHVSEFKGLESNSVLLYVHNLGSMPDEELLVGVSRARSFLAIVINSYAEKGLSVSARRFLRDVLQQDMRSDGYSAKTS